MQFHVATEMALALGLEGTVLTEELKLGLRLVLLFGFYHLLSSDSNFRFQCFNIC